MSVQRATLLQTAVDPSLSAAVLAERLRWDWPDLGDVVPGTAGDGPISLRVSDALVALVQVPSMTSADVDELERRSRLWPDDHAPIVHGAHTVVTVMDHGGRLDDLGKTVLLSKVITSVVGLDGPVVAVYWGAADHLILPDLFAELTRSSDPHDLVPAWVAVNVGSRPTGEMTGHTRGMDMLGLKDIEIPSTTDPTEDVVDRLNGLVEYLIDNGMVVKDGDTIGSDATEQILVTYAESAFSDGRQVLRLGPPPPRSRWTRG